jgi:hypothetical protein
MRQCMLMAAVWVWSITCQHFTLSSSMPVSENGVAEVVDASTAVNILIVIHICCYDDGNWREYQEQVHQEPIMVRLFCDHDGGLNKDDSR